MKRTWLQNNKHWFDRSTALEFKEDTIWDGSNSISVNTFDQWVRQKLYLTASDTPSWVLGTVGNEQADYRQISDDEAVSWLARNGYDESEYGLPDRFRSLIKKHLAAVEV